MGSLAGPWGIAYYRAADGRVPGQEFLVSCPLKVRATLRAVLEAVREAPPPAFSGGGKWEAMHGDMAGIYEVRVTGPGRRHYRLFCVLENGTHAELASRGLDGPYLIILNGLVKANATLFTRRVYTEQVRHLADHYRATMPRPILR